MGSLTKIYQIFYKKGQIDQLDPAFIPLDCTRNPAPSLFEVYWQYRFYASGLYREADYTGLMSWRFQSKTRVPGKKFVDFIAKNPGFDVYFINPYPQLAYQFFDVWGHGEHCHPGIADLAERLLAEARYSASLTDIGRNNHNTLLYCNYWVGNAIFWEAYIAFIKPLLELSIAIQPDGRKNPYFRMTIHDGGSAPFFPFIFERLFSTFLLAIDGITALPYVYSREEILDRAENHDERIILQRCIPAIDDLDLRFSRKSSAQHRALFITLTDCWNGRRKQSAPTESTTIR